MTDSQNPRRSKSDLEDVVKQHGGTIFHSETARRHVIIIADRGTFPSWMTADVVLELVKVAALKKRGDHDILRPSWLLESVQLGTLLPLEPR